ncbi:hypothetical protein [Trichlorobacter sp.]|uniref:hypothetical protein n=1 Tax=Trichlorobacter sp. TaxID=2911007 RepID=UPI002A36E749|nr:hypothetical protein [Trichlorobacter sp.]MDY0385086.1 hypothetical protein [Trichlorobacter sp.]
MEFVIEQEITRGESFGDYRYSIYRDGKLVANYWHDYRGDEHGIIIVGYSQELWPVGRMVDFIEGGGTKPLKLSEKAISYLKTRLSAV